MYLFNRTIETTGEMDVIVPVLLDLKKLRTMPLASMSPFGSAGMVSEMEQSSSLFPTRP